MSVVGVMPGRQHGRSSILTVLALIAVLAGTASARDDEPQGTKLYDMGQVAEFELVDQTGAPFTRDDLLGSRWVVDFIFTSCAGPCPRMTADMKRMAAMLKDDPTVKFLSISVDPERDTPEVLAAYGEKYDADPGRWKFVTGDKALIYRLAADSFYLPIEDPEDTDQVIHSTRFVVMDTAGHVRGYHDQQSDTDPALGVERSLQLLAAGSVGDGAIARPGDRDTILPTVNATLNGLAALLLVVGYALVRRQNVAAHKKCMLAAVSCSALFLISYLYYHYQVGSVKYQGDGPLRVLYLGILLTHTVLAVVIVPLVLMTLWRAFKDQRERHRRIARITLPIWLYVSVTGVVIYWMLYHGPGRG